MFFTTPFTDFHVGTLYVFSPLSIGNEGVSKFLVVNCEEPILLDFFKNSRKYGFICSLDLYTFSICEVFIVLLDFTERGYTPSFLMEVGFSFFSSLLCSIPNNSRKNC